MAYTPYITRTLKPSRGSFFLFGCRGTGKSTWLRAQMPQAYWIDLLDEGRYQLYLAQPARLGDELRALGRGAWVVIDEVQRLPWALNTVHQFIERGGVRFALCGSSVRKLRRTGVNMLAGRAVLRTMHPFTPQELGARFSLESALKTGLLPIVWCSPHREETLAAYATMYLKEEIQAEALVRNLPSFARFVSVAALLHGQIMNLANVAREAGVARASVEAYFDILRETMVGFSIAGFEPRLRVKERSHPKWYWSDPGIARAMKRHTGPLAPEERGVLFEGLVAQLLRAFNDYHGLYDVMSYWSPGAPAAQEVDFVLQRGKDLLALEAKSGRVFQENWCRSLRAFGELPRVRRRMIVYPHGPRLKTHDGIEVLPFDAWCAELADGTLWP